MDHPFEYDLLCIGAGPAGRSAALAAAKLGKRVGVIEKQRTLASLGAHGGTIPSKTLREAVRSYKLGRRATHFADITVVENPDLGSLRERIVEVCEREAATASDNLARNGVELVCGMARFVDSHTLAIESAHGVRDVTTDHVLIATGARARELEGVSCDGEVLLDVESVLERNDLPRTMIVVGCGIVGLEYGSMFAALGVEVTIVDKSAGPLGFLDCSIFEELVALLRLQRVTLRFGEEVVGAGVDTSETGRRAVVNLADGTKLTAETALFAASRYGITESLRLADVGIATNPRGMLTVDADFRTAQPHVFAVGDVIGRTAQASTSVEQGRIAVYRMFDVEVPRLSDCEVIGIYSVPEISMVGATEQQLAASEVPFVAGFARYREIARGAITGDEFGLFKMLFDRRDRRLAGVHCLGVNSTELIHVGQAVISLHGTLDYFLSNVFNYPTLAECYKVAALDAANHLRE